VLLLNGTGETGSSFDPLAASLADRFRCVATDARDTGASSRASEPYTPADLAVDAAAIVDALALGPCHVVGFSLGGATAMELALARPDRVRSLVLLSTWARSDRYLRHQMRNWQAIRRATVGDEPAFLTALNPWMFSPITLEDTEKLRAIGATWLEEPHQEPDAFIRQTLADEAHDALGRLGAIEAPALVIVGEDDVCTPPRYAIELVHALPDARLVLVPDAGHCAIFEQADVVHAAVGTFLDARA
jgi:pimeloyl-ACP methyl ester carboxylesterase